MKKERFWLVILTKSRKEHWFTSYFPNALYLFVLFSYNKSELGWCLYPYLWTKKKQNVTSVSGPIPEQEWSTRPILSFLGGIKRLTCLLLCSQPCPLAGASFSWPPWHSTCLVHDTLLPWLNTPPNQRGEVVPNPAHFRASSMLFHFAFLCLTYLKCMRFFCLV